jgi:hypothetical protein
MNIFNMYSYEALKTTPCGLVSGIYLLLNGVYFKKLQKFIIICQVCMKMAQEITIAFTKKLIAD